MNKIENLIQLKTGELKLKITENKVNKKLFKFGSRINKKRGFLFISTVLGKHIPTSPDDMLWLYDNLSKEILKNIDTNKKTLVIGFAETATALGEGVYRKLNLDNSIYTQSTRYKFNKEILLNFYEEHCHAPSHIFYMPENKNILKDVEQVILIDDEVTTGNTANNLVQELKKVLPNAKTFKLATILNWSKNKYKDFEYIYLIKGDYNFQFNSNIIKKQYKSIPDKIKNLDNIVNTKNSSRFGITQNEKYKIPDIKIYNKKILVIGTGEFMYKPFLLANKLKKNKNKVYCQSTTRSPINIDCEIKNKLEFKDNYFENIDNFLYNIKDKKYDVIIICYETKKTPKEFNLKSQIKNNAKEIIEIIL